MPGKVRRDDDLESRDARKVEDHPNAINPNDRKTLSEEAALPERDVQRWSTEKTFEEQATRSGRDLNPESEKKKDVVGSALPEEEGHRG